MSIQTALILSVILQFTTAIIAMTLIKRTRTNIAWWLISLGFLLMAFRRLFEIYIANNPQEEFSIRLLNSWTGVLISIIMLFSLIFIRRIFNLQKQFDQLRKQNESKVLSAIIKTEEHERQHFAKELHDGLGPLLSSVKMSISATKQKEDTPNQILENAEKLIDESITTLKEVSFKLSPHILNNFGLQKAIKSFINKLKLLDKPDIHFESNIENQRYAYNTEVVLYRVITELLSNSLKHAKATSISIKLMSDNEILSLHYTDDGIGFDSGNHDYEKKGMGYSNISSRIKSLNGEFQIYSEKGEGFCAYIDIRLN